MGTGSEGSATTAILTLPNVISFSRILLIPVFVPLLLRPGTEVAGLLVLGIASASDWVDGYVARRTGRVSELGKLLDPTADRLVIAAGLIALAARGALPLWAALLILLRDLTVLLGGALLLALRHIRVEVRVIGKAATFSLMMAVPLIAWGSFNLPLAAAALAVGWTAYAVGIVECYVAAGLYASDSVKAWNAA